MRRFGGRLGRLSSRRSRWGRFGICCRGGEIGGELSSRRGRLGKLSGRRGRRGRLDMLSGQMWGRLGMQVVGSVGSAHQHRAALSRREEPKGGE